MGAEEAARILIAMLKAYAERFTDDERELIAETAIEYVRLACISRTPEEEDAYKSIKNALAQAANKIAIAAIKEAESYQSIQKVIKILTA